MPARGGHIIIRDMIIIIVSFNTRARARRARYLPTSSKTTARFNTRARARRARFKTSFKRGIKMFQHTCPREADTADLAELLNATFGFQHTCPREAGTSVMLWGAVLLAFQHTCPREAGTPYDYDCSPLLSRFNTRARARRALANFGFLCLSFFSFNTRARARRAPAQAICADFGNLVSTHVPARGGHL